MHNSKYHIIANGIISLLFGVPFCGKLFRITDEMSETSRKENVKDVYKL